MTKFKEATNLIGQGKLEEAKDMFEKILKEDPNNIDALYNLGMCFTDLGQPEKAIITLERCIKYKSDFSNAYVALGNAYYKIKDFDNAEKFFFDALKIDPKNSFALSNLGGLFGATGDIEKSLFYLEKAYRINSLNPNTVYGLGYAYEQMELYEKADKYYKEILEMEAPTHLKKLAKDGLRKIAVSDFKSKGFRIDAVFYLMGALELFKQKSKNEIKDIAFEIGVKGKEGLDLDNPEKKYKLNSLAGEFTGLQLVYLFSCQIDRVLV